MEDAAASALPNAPPEAPPEPFDVEELKGPQPFDVESLQAPTPASVPPLRAAMRPGQQFSPGVIARFRNGDAVTKAAQALAGDYATNFNAGVADDMQKFEDLGIKQGTLRTLGQALVHGAAFVKAGITAAFPAVLGGVQAGATEVLGKEGGQAVAQATAIAMTDASIQTMLMSGSQYSEATKVKRAPDGSYVDEHLGPVPDETAAAIQAQRIADYHGMPDAAETIKESYHQGVLPVEIHTDMSPEITADLAAKEVPKAYPTEQWSGPKLQEITKEEAGYTVSDPGEKFYAINNAEGQRTGTAVIAVEGNKARIVDIFSNADKAKMTFGTSAVRGLMRQFLRENPEVTEFTGERVSGARFGGLTAIERSYTPGREVSVRPKPLTPIHGTGEEKVRGLSAEPPPPSAGTIRLYHGGEPGNGPRSFTKDYAYAKAYADKSGAPVLYVDVPVTHPALEHPNPSEGIAGNLNNVTLPADVSEQAKPIGDTVRLYRGENSANEKGGGWFTTNPQKAALYGKVSYVDVPRTELNKFAQGHGGPDEFLTDDAQIKASAKPLEPGTTEAPKATGPTRLRPIGDQGETSVSGLAETAEASAINKQLVENFGDLPELGVAKDATQGPKAEALLLKDPELARDIALNGKQPPPGTLASAVYVAVLRKAERDGDIELIRQLGTQSQFLGQVRRMGQESSYLRNVNEGDPSVAINNLQQARREGLAAKGVDVQANDNFARQEFAPIRAATKAPKPIGAWEKFMAQIRCAE